MKKPDESHRPALLRILTNSERITMACKRRWRFRYLDGLSTGDTAAPLRAGDLWHQCLAALYRRIQAKTSLIFPSTHVDEPVSVEGSWIEEAKAISDSVIAPWLEQRRAWAFSFFREAMTMARRDEVLIEDVDAADTIKGMLQGYVHDYAAEDAKRWEILGVECQLSRWLPHPESGKPIRDRVQLGDVQRSRRWAYGGGIDLLVRDRADGSHWLVEHKTTAETDLDNYLRKLHWDPQIRGYAWALRDPIAAVSDIKEPIRVTGVIYNVARKKVPRIPETIKNGDLSRAKIDTTREVYLGAILAHGFNPDDYADMLETLQGRSFFGRERYHFTDPNLEDWEKNTAADALNAIATVKANRFPRTELCTMFGAPECPYSSICLEDGPMARKNFTVLGIRHTELHSAMAEPYAAQERGLTMGSTEQPTAVAVEPRANNAIASGSGGITADPFAS